MNRSLRLAPPKVRLEAASGGGSLPSRGPSGSKQWTPAWAAAQIRPVPASRVPSKSPASQGATPSPGGRGTAAGDVEEPDVLGAGIGDVELAFAGGEGEPVRAQEPAAAMRASPASGAMR